jgi:phospholipase/lecithinase/hemolysin
MTLFISSAQAYDKLFVFGDSLSDSGVQDQNPAVPNGKAPAWTTFGGYTWPHYLVQELHLPAIAPNNTTFDKDDDKNTYVSASLNGTNYASGGATTDGEGFKAHQAYSPPSMLAQVISFTQNGKAGVADPNALYIIWAGSNDIASIMTKDLEAKRYLHLFGDLRKTQEAAIENLQQAVTLLKAAGAEKIAVLTVPNMGVLALFQPTSPFYKAADMDLKQATRTSQLLSFISYNFAYELKRAFRHSDVTVVDIWHLTTNVTATEPGGVYTSQSGKTFKIDNTNDSACGENTILTAEALTCMPLPNTNNYLFADGGHFSDLLHRIVADDVAYTLTQQKE